MVVPEPKTFAGKWKRIKSERDAEQTGQRYCGSCRQYRPKDQVKLRLRMKGQGGIWRCDTCQERRVAYLREARLSTKGELK